MKPRRVPILAAVLALLPVAAWPAPAAETILPLHEVRPGMAAVVRTVIQGDRIEDLPAEVVAVMENALGPGQSLILARLSGDTAAFIGVAAGMSGSPVYVDGRLMGALSYRFGAFTKEPIAGITPIEYMLDLARPAPAAGARRLPLSGAAAARDLPVASIPLVIQGDPRAPGAEGLSATAAMIPIESPLVVTGVPAEILQHFAGQFASLGAVAVAGGGGGGVIAPAAPRAVRPGDPIAAQLVRGDISIAATGTVTHVEGDRVLAFGHPFLMSGAAEFPMARAEIYLTLASLAASSKIARVTDTIGTWEQIRLPGISGVTSRTPALIPVSVTVRTPGRAAAYHYEVASHRDWTPLLVAISVAGSLVNTPAFTDESTLTVSHRLRLEGHPDVVVEDLYTGIGPGSSAALSVAADVQEIFTAVFQNRFEAPRVRSIELAAEGIEEGRLAFVEGVWPSRTEAAPGEDVQYHVRLRSYRGDTSTQTFTFNVPESAPRGDLQVVIGGAGYLLASERQVLARRVAGADDLDQIIGIVNHLRRSNVLYAKVVRRLPGAVVQSEILPALPPSVLTTLRSNRGSGDVAPLTEATVWENSIQTPSIVTGGAALILKVR